MIQGILYVVATPIGNIGDMSGRAKLVFSEVDGIYAEDTRVTKKLLGFFEIENDVKTLNTFGGETIFRAILDRLRAGESLAYTSDAGTPAISDPGGLLVQYLYNNDFTNVVAVPGPSAVIAALSISGIRADKFVFLGFPPQKNKRNKFFVEVMESKHTVVFYESGHRIHKTLETLREVLDENRVVFVARELTKKFESVYRGSVTEIISMDIPKKGEFVIVVNGAK